MPHGIRDRLLQVSLYDATVCVIQAQTFANQAARMNTGRNIAEQPRRFDAKTRSRPPPQKLRKYSQAYTAQSSNVSFTWPPCESVRKIQIRPYTPPTSNRKPSSAIAVLLPRSFRSRFHWWFLPPPPSLLCSLRPRPPTRLILAPERRPQPSPRQTHPGSYAAPGPVSPSGGGRKRRETCLL